MKRVQVHLSDKQVERLKQLAIEKDLSMAEIIRRILDNAPEMKPTELIGEIVYPEQEKK